MEQDIRIVVAHGDCLLRDEVESQFGAESGVDLCAVEPAVDNVRRLVLRHDPHVAMINISLKCSVGMFALKALKEEFPKVRVLAFSCHSECENMDAGVAFYSGADGYISSVDVPSQLVMAVQTVQRGERYISPQVAIPLKKSKKISVLSRQEAEVFYLTGCGHVTKRIAEIMEVNVKTVQSYQERIRLKMNLASGAELLYSAVTFLRSAARHGLDESDNREMIRELLSAKA